MRNREPLNSSASYLTELTIFLRFMIWEKERIKIELRSASYKNREIIYARSMHKARDKS